LSDEIQQTNIAKGGTVLKTFRIPKRLYAEIQAEAKAKGLSPNALVSTILTRFVDWDKFSLRFGYVTISKETLTSAFALINEKELNESALKIGSRLPREAIMFWFKKVNVETFLMYLENTCTFGGQAEYECQVSGRDYTITLHHDLGGKWSSWLRFMLDGALRGMFNIAAQFEVSESEVIIRFYAPPASVEPRA